MLFLFCYFLLLFSQFSAGVESPPYIFGKKYAKIVGAELVSALKSGDC